MSESPFRALSYAAVSTEVQASDDKGSIEAQLEANRQASERYGWPIVAEIAIRGHSRSYFWLDEIVADCPEYRELVRLIRSGTINLILCWRYNRLWRGYLQGQIQALCAQHGVQIYATQEPSQPVPPDELKLANETELLQLFAGWRARREIQDLKTNLRVGMRKRIEMGLHGSVGRVPYGYRRQLGQNKPHLIDEDEARWVRWIFERRAERVGYHSIVSELERLGVPTKTKTGSWQTSRIASMVRNDYYVGAVSWGEFHNPNGLHEPIISKELWDRVQAANSRQTVSLVRAIRPLSGLMQCGDCGYYMAYAGRSGANGRYVACRERDSLPRQRRTCKGNHHLSEPIERYVRERFKAIIGDPDIYFDEREASQPTAELEAELKAIEQLLAKANRDKERWDAAYVNEVIGLEELARHRAEHKESTDDLVRRQTEIRARLAAVSATRDTIVTLKDVVGVIDTLSGEELNALYRQLIDRIIIYKDGTIKLILL